MIIFYFSPNVDWDTIKTTFGFTIDDIENLTYKNCIDLQKFAFKEWGGEILMFTPETFAILFNDGSISDEGYIKIFSNN